MEYKAQMLKYWLPAQKWLVGVLVVVCGILLAQVTWVFLSPATEVVAPRIAAASNKQADGGENWMQVSREVASREFFGDVIIESAEPTAKEVDAPETKLNLQLQAVMAQGDGLGFAVISQRSGTGKVFGLGDDLFGDATLTNVFGDRVIIDRRGQLETLRYERQDSNSILQTVEPTRSADAKPSDTFQEALAQANSEVANGGDLQSQVQGMVDYVTRRANEDPEGFVQEMGLQPTADGYQVTRRARQLQMVGLRPGDIVTSVNDMQVGNVQSDQALLNQILQTGGELKIQIRRGSRSFTIYQSIPTY